MSVVSSQLCDLESVRAFLEAFDEQAGSATRARLLERAHERRARVRRALELGDADLVVEAQVASRRRRRTLAGLLARDELEALCRDVAAGRGEARALEDDPRSEVVEFVRELVHLWDPAKVALWTSWVWAPDDETGALALMVEDPAALLGADDAEVAGRVGEASRYLAAVLEAAGLGVDAADPLSFDVAAAAVWATYAVTVVRLRMTKEFTQLLPPAAGFAERALGLAREG